MVRNRQTSSPVDAFTATTNPNNGESPPATPVTTRSPTTSGAAVEPYAPTLSVGKKICHTSAPVSRFSATRCASSVAKKTLSPNNAAPRCAPLAASPEIERASPRGRTQHQISRPVVLSSAHTWFGAVTYIIPSATNGVVCRLMCGNA